MLKHKCVDVNQAGNRGSTPLHHCAYKDKDKIAVILVRVMALSVKHLQFHTEEVKE